MGEYLKCVGIGKSYSMKLDWNEAFHSIISKKRYDRHQYQALKDISFELEEGDRLGIIGSNGAGKSTLLRIIGGIIKPTAGHIYVKGTSTAILEPNNLLYADLTGIENIRIVGRLLGIKKQNIDRHIDQIVEYSEIGPFVHQVVRFYSSGMMLRLTMAIYKFLRPDVLLMDEVMSVGDFNFRNKIYDTFKNDFSDIPIMIMVSHEMKDIVGMCNKCIYLKDGELVYFGKTEDVYKKYSLEHIQKKISNDQKSQLEVECAQKQYVKKFSEKIVLSFKLIIREELKEPWLVLYVNTSLSPIIIDSPLFRRDNNMHLKKGCYDIEITVPAHLLNKGSYFTRCVIGTGHGDSMVVINEFSLGDIEIIPDDWESNEYWNLNPKYPIRPQLDWEIKSGV